MYYVNHNACATLADAEQVLKLYRDAGVPADILTEAEYFELGLTSTAEGRSRLHELILRAIRTLH